MQKNIDFVAYMPQEVSSWGFHIAGKAKKTSEISDEILGISRKVFDITKGFFIPTKIKYDMLFFSDDLSASEVFELIKPSSIIQRGIVSDTGISFHKFLEKVQGNEIVKNEIKYLRRIDIHNGKTKFVLQRKDEYIDKNSKGLYVTWGYDEVLDEQPTSDPIRIDISHSHLKGKDQNVESVDPAYYEIIFWTYTDIWFEKTEIGLANRNRLKNVLKKIYENFNVVHTLFLSDWFSEKELKDVVLG